MLDRMEGRTNDLRIIDNLSVRTHEIAAHLDELLVDGYLESDLGEVARDAAALWETNLKAAWADRPGNTLNALANGLLALEWNASKSLHVVRSAANTAKHEHGAVHDADSIATALSDLVTEAPALELLVPGVLTELPVQLRRRRMVCAIYDHFAQGETGYVILAAAPEDTWQTATSIDGFQVSGSTSDVEAALASLDEWEWSPASFEDLALSLRQSDSEFWRLGVFMATYQDILDLMQPFQHNRDLLPGLHREDDRGNVTASAVAAILAGTEFSGSGRAPERTGVTLRRVAIMLSSLPPHVRPTQVDRCSGDAFQARLPTAVASDIEIGALITPSGVVFVRG